MKKIIILLFCFLLTGALFACKGDDISASLPPADDPIGEYDEASKVVVENVSDTEDGNFDIKYKKYDYLDGNAVILNFKNQTNTNYKVTITASYTNTDGSVLKTESQTYKDIASGTETYFIFNPGIAFESFDYDVQAEVYEGVCFLSNIKQLEWDMNSKDANILAWPIYDSGVESASYWALYGSPQYENKNPDIMARKMIAVSFNTKGEILNITQSGWKLMSPGKNKVDINVANSDQSFTAKQSTWPEEFKDGFDILLVAVDYMSEEEFYGMR